MQHMSRTNNKAHSRRQPLGHRPNCCRRHRLLPPPLLLCPTERLGVSERMTGIWLIWLECDREPPLADDFSPSSCGSVGIDGRRVPPRRRSVAAAAAARADTSSVAHCLIEPPRKVKKNSAVWEFPGPIYGRSRFSASDRCIACTSSAPCAKGEYM